MKLIIVALVMTGVTSFVGLSNAGVLALQTQNFKVTEMMTVEEFRASGLTKLTPEEMKQLDAWLNRYTLKVARAVLEKQPQVPPALLNPRLLKPELMESSKDGTGILFSN